MILTRGNLVPHCVSKTLQECHRKESCTLGVAEKN